MGPYCLLGIVCFDLMQGKKVHGADFQSLSFLDNFGNGVAKSGRRHSNKKSINNSSGFIVQLMQIAFLSRLLK